LPRQARGGAGDEHSGPSHSPARGRSSRCPRLLACAAVVLACLSLFGSAAAQDAPNQPLSIKIPDGLATGPQSWTSPEGLSSTIQVMLLLTVLSLAPAVLLMTTCFVRIIVVLGLLRQAIGTQQLPPSQVITAMALFVTLLIMTPVWKQVYDDAIVPYTQRQISLEQAWTAGVAPIRRFMSMQIERTGNTEDVHLFLSYLPHQPSVAQYEDVPLQALVPAFMLSELKTAFLIGFQIYLPFLILDMVIASVMVSMGMLMLPPVLISLPFKLLLFVLVDGWHLVVGMLMESFQPFT
jgi:flagellar biosynthetic protein FliP